MSHDHYYRDDDDMRPSTYKWANGWQSTNKEPSFEELASMAKAKLLQKRQSEIQAKEQAERQEIERKKRIRDAELLQLFMTIVTTVTNAPAFGQHVQVKHQRNNRTHPVALFKDPQLIIKVNQIGIKMERKSEAMGVPGGGSSYGCAGGSAMVEDCWEFWADESCFNTGDAMTATGQ